MTPRSTSAVAFLEIKEGKFTKFQHVQEKVSVIKEESRVLTQK